MLNPSAEMTLNNAMMKAKKKRHEFLTVEHLTLELLDNPEVLDVLQQFSTVNVDEIKGKLTQYINEVTPKISQSSRNKETQATLSVQRVLQQAVAQLKFEGRDQATPVDVFKAILKEKIGKSSELLKEAGISRQQIDRYLSENVPTQTSTSKSPTKEMRVALSEGYAPILEDDPNSVLINLNSKAQAGRITPVIGRENEVLQLIQILSRRQKNNPLLLGEPGVGKTAIVEGLALKIVEGKVPSLLRKAVIYQLDLSGLIAGTRFRGDFEQRVQSVLDKFKTSPNAVLFIDEIHTIMGAGAVSGNTLDLANVLKPVLTSGEFKCIGATTYEEYRRVFEKDSAMARRFQTVDVMEPTPEQTLQILKGLRGKFEDHHRVSYSEDALKSAVELSVRYLPHRFLPDKAIDIIDEAGALYGLMPAASRGPMVDRKLIEKVVAKMAKLPDMEVSRTVPEMLKELDRNLQSVIFGQDESIQVLVDAIKLVSSGLREGEKPIGSFLFMGPTGVGKTEVAKQLARFMGVPLLRYDMSEYKESYTLSRLVGAPPGYVGHDQGGLLTDDVNKHPHCVLLLDEIEKAHPDIYNLLLQVMDHGVLTDARGKKTDFRHVILIMTTNAGAENMSRQKIGFATGDQVMEGLEEVQRVFSPEFRNRLDGVIVFKPLEQSIVCRVTEKLLLELAEQLKKKEVTLEVDDAAKNWLSQKGYDAAMGARPMERLIQQVLKKPLADELLFGCLTQGGKVQVTVKDECLSIMAYPGRTGEAREIRSEKL